MQKEKRISLISFNTIYKQYFNYCKLSNLYVYKTLN